MNTKYPFFQGDERTEVIVKESKQVQGLRYEYFKRPKRALTVWYGNKQVMASSRYCKVTKAIPAIEAFIASYADIMALADTGKPYDRDRAFELRSKLMEVFSNTVA